jgi:YidC/Oxa1 family membrane protein insertase
VDKLLKPIEDAIGWLLQLIYSLPPHNLGISIILMTCVVMSLMLPLTAKQVRSTVAMQKLAPEIKKLQQEHKDDRQKQSEEVMKFYKENQINPLSGCLPLLVQLPVWIALYRTLQGIPKHIGTSSRLYVDLCNKLSAADCLRDGSKAMQAPKFLWMDLRLTLLKAKDLSDASFVSLLPYGLLVGFVVATGVLQTRQTMARQKKQNPDAPVNPQMQTMMRVMPFMNVMTAFFPVGVALYWGARNVWMIGQQHFVLGKFYGEPVAAGKADSAITAKATEVSPRSAARTNPNTSKKKQQRRKR